MESYIYNIIIVLISSGVLGTIITAISKKRERNSVDRIRDIVKAQNLALQEHVYKLAKNQAKLAEGIRIVSTKVDTLKEQQNLLHNEFIQLRSESEEVDLLLLQKLREKKIFNGESNEIYNILLNQRNRFSSLEEKQQVTNAVNKQDFKLDIDLKDFDLDDNKENS